MEFGDYQICSVCVDNSLIEGAGLPVIIPRSLIASLTPDKTHHINVELHDRTNSI